MPTKHPIIHRIPLPLQTQTTHPTLVSNHQCRITITYPIISIKVHRLSWMNKTKVNSYFTTITLRNSKISSWKLTGLFTKSLINSCFKSKLPTKWPDWLMVRTYQSLVTQFSNKTKASSTRTICISRTATLLSIKTGTTMSTTN